MPEILTDTYLLFTFVFKQALRKILQVCLIRFRFLLLLLHQDE